MIVRYLQERNPFNGEPTLRCLASWRAAESSVNADQAKLLGENVLRGMIGKNALEITFKRKHKVATRATKSAVKINGDTIQVDPSLLFQRLIKVAEATPTVLASAFFFALSNTPISLFDTSGLSRQAKKAALAQFNWSISKQTNSQLPQNAVFVINEASYCTSCPDLVDPQIANCRRCTATLSIVCMGKELWSLMATVTGRRPKT